jgi:N,N'-diacetyllegionaminate synthase
MIRVGIGDKFVGASEPVYIIAEIGGNFTTAPEGKRLVKLAAEAGCDAVKLQTFRAETLTSRKAMFHMENTGSIPQWEHFFKFELSRQIHEEVFSFARDLGIEIFSTPSHQTDIDLLEELGVSAYKIGSDDAINLPLLRHAARTRKPVLLSTGMCTLSEVRRSVDSILEEGSDQLILFHCTTSYPTHPEEVNLKAMLTLEREFGLPVGYSDHTLGIDVSYAAAVLGARSVEFHFTHDKTADGPDHMLSKDAAEVAQLVKKIRLLPTLMGDGVKRPTPTEMTTRRNNRKGLVTAAAIRKGDRLTRENLTIKRPATGIGCEHYENVLGKAAGRDIEADAALSWDDLC